MKFYKEEDLTEENLKKAWAEIDELSRIADEKARLLKESPKPELNTIEEALKYYNAIPFQEWENKMFERLGMNENDSD